MLQKLVLLYLFLGLCHSRQEVLGGDFPSQGAIYPLKGGDFPSQGAIYPLKGGTNNLYKGDAYSDLHLQENHQLQVQRFLREPPDQTAKIGEQVTLPCRVENKKGKLQWTRDDFGLGQGRDLTGFDRYEMTGSDQEGDYTLNIFPVHLEDDAVFQCQVGAARGIAPIRSRYATLTVTVPPEPPVILNGEVLKVTEDRLITVECVSKAGKPAAEITWLDSDNIPIRVDVETIVEVLEDGKRQNTISLLRRKARRSDNLRNLTCEAQNSAESIPSRATIQIHVEYAPHVTLQYQPHKLQDGETVTFKCSADANPSDVSYKWYLNNQVLEGKTSKTLTLSPLNRTLHAAILKCAARNKIGRSEETHTLEIMYGPSWVVEPSDQAGQEREQVQLICLADSNPNPRYSWFKDGDFENIISSSSNLTIYLNLQAQGKYTCRVSVKGFSGLERSAQVLIKGPPLVLGSGSVQVGLGEKVELHCSATGIPTPRNILWIHAGGILGNRDGYSIHVHTRDGGIHSSLILQRVEKFDLGEYNCSASNNFGTHHQTIILQLKEEKSLAVPLGVGVGGGVLLTLLLLLLVLHCRSTSEKPIPRAPSPDQDEWETETLTKDKHLLQVQEEDAPLNQHFDQSNQCHPADKFRTNSNQSPLADKFKNIKLNVQDPHYSAVYGNPYLRSAIDGPYYGDIYEQNYTTDEIMYNPSPGNGAVHAQYVIRQDLLGNSLATHV